jgi:lipopolysaccharide export system permease protein
LERADGTSNEQTTLMFRLTIIDKYILKSYLLTFFGILFLFVPIGILASLAEKVNKILESKATAEEIWTYYGNFTLVLGNMLMPILLFLAIIFFTSRLSARSEVVAILSSGISFQRFLRPYLIGATFVALLIFFMSNFIVPSASAKYHAFEDAYFQINKEDRQIRNIYNQVAENDFVYVSFFDPERLIGYNFTLEHFDDSGKLEYKLFASNIRFMTVDSTYRLTTYKKRIFNKEFEYVEQKRSLDTVFNFTIDDLMPVSYIAETKNLFELNQFIEDQKRRGSATVNSYILEKYKRLVLPLSAYILTLIAVAVSSVKRRGGLGLNLAFGIAIAFIYIFFDRVFSTLAEQAGFSPLMAALIPVFFFASIAVFLLQRAKR